MTSKKNFPQKLFSSISRLLRILDFKNFLLDPRKCSYKSEAWNIFKKAFTFILTWTVQHERLLLSFEGTIVKSQFIALWNVGKYFYAHPW